MAIKTDEVLDGAADTEAAPRRLLFSAISGGDVDKDRLCVKLRCLALGIFVDD